MPFEDKTLLCLECGAEFEYSADQQQRYAERGFTAEPRRCPACRESFRESRQLDRAVARPPLHAGRGSGGVAAAPPPIGQREFFPAVCSACGRATQVPFKPAEGRPVYCRDCHQLRRQAMGDRG